MMKITNVNAYIDGAFHPASLWIEDGRFQRIVTSGDKTVAAGDLGEAVLDGQGLRLVPGFIDVHTHGAVGVDVNAADSEGLDKISQFFASKGVTAWNASIVTDTEENTIRCLRDVAEKTKSGTMGARLLGSHLEGPFISQEYRGSMPEHLLIEGDASLLEHYIEASDHTVTYITVAPEVPGVPDLIRRFGKDIPFSLGHSSATYEISRKAIDDGAVSMTHLFNAMRLFHQHEPGIMGAALESDCLCELICDGRHLAPSTVRMVVKCKSYDFLVAITDSIMATGFPDGRYQLGVNDIVVEEGDAKLASNGVRAGSTLTLDKALKNIASFTGDPIEKILPMFSANPAKVLRMEDEIGKLDKGYLADCVLIDPMQEVLWTMVGGRIVYQSQLENKD